MDSAPTKAFLLAQLLLLLCCFQEASCFFPHPPSPAPSLAPLQPPVHPPVKPPAHPPVKPPVHPPVKPPAQPPVKPPAHPPPSSRGFIAVQGVVYCKSCKNTFYGAKPISGAQVKLICNNRRFPVVATAKTDKNGYFFLQAPKTVTSFAAHKCKIYLLSSPKSSCKEPSNINGGLTGASLRFEKLFLSFKNPFILYSVGPLAFQPKCKGPPAK